MNAILLLALVSSASAFAQKNDLYDDLKKELPVGNYVGKQHRASKSCEIKVSEKKDKEYGAIYTVAVVYESGKTYEFEMRQKGEVFVGGNYVARYKKGEDRTSLNVARGKAMKSNDTYWEGWEKELYLSIEEREKQAGFKKGEKPWRVTVSVRNGSSVGAGSLTCHILALHD